MGKATVAKRAMLPIATGECSNSMHPNTVAASLGFLTGVHIWMLAIAHGACTNTEKGSALKVDWEKGPSPH